MGIHDGHREKMRRRFRTGGLDSFADHEALELLLFYAIPRKDTNEIAHLLLERYGSLSAVFNAPVEDLMKSEGIGEGTAVFLKLVPQICQKAKLHDLVKDTILNSTEKIGAYLIERFAGETSEVLYELCLDRKCKLLACKRLSEGGADSADLSIRRLLQNALLNSASGVILAHNHPSGIALPSPEDYAATDQAYLALQTINVPLLDHIIVADGDFISMKDSGMMEIFA